MAVGFTVKRYLYTIGGDFLHAFFSTVCRRLENEQWGSKYPHIMRELYQGELPVEHLQQAEKELAQIKRGLAQLAPDQVIWDIEDRSLTPPWGDRISNSITDLGNYFVTSSGEDFLEVFHNALTKAQQLQVPLRIQAL
ncbi:immunity 70 family protein [Agathobaculum sp. LCP25S3_E8]|uniref:immunity 70 family protein n=1 Tax=Agathobaculum sp. LCP25S3_E8 TaxID=3438735 RepID=UPI003F8EA65E